MVISQSQLTVNLIDSVYRKVKTILGTQYLNILGNKTIKYVSQLPTDYKATLNDTPIVYVSMRGRMRSLLAEQGGRTEFCRTIHIHVLAGGYSDESQNEMMKQDILDKLEFGFDRKVHVLTNASTGIVEGQYRTEAQELYRVILDDSDEFEKLHGTMAVNAYVLVYNT